jgi:hypothetical protein
VQHIVFGTYGPYEELRIHENILPTSVLASIVLAGVAAPFLPKQLGPLAIAQARRPRPIEEVVLEAPSAQPLPPSRPLQRSKTVSGDRTTPERRARVGHIRNISDSPVSPSSEAKQLRPHRARPQAQRNHTVTSAGQVRPQPTPAQGHRALLGASQKSLSSASLPDFSKSNAQIQRMVLDRKPSSTSVTGKRFPDVSRRGSPVLQTQAFAKALSKEEQTHLLRANYFRSQTQFLTALESISNRLVPVPKPARLSALRAELALITQDLPAEVDIPMLCPATLVDGSPAKSRHHRVVRISPAEATSLNSAERVPYLLMIEVLRDDFDFNPDTEANQALLAAKQSQKDFGRRRLFDVSTRARMSVEEASFEPDSVFEPANGDLSSPALLQQFDENEVIRNGRATPISTAEPYLRSIAPRSSSGGGTLSTRSVLSTPRTSDIPNTRSASPALGFGTYSAYKTDQHDLSAMATHMRTAAQMLAQLDVSGAKRPKHEVEAIKAKIIASMQTLEEQSFNDDQNHQKPSFDTIMADVQAGGTETPDELEDGIDVDPTTITGAGAARMENDQKTGGVRRKGDRDDPSAAMFGEDWKTKRERIRRSSPYGREPNWDLLSVIVKTGSDLRQEMFATQLIRICSKVWEDAKVPVWVKNMRILVTGDSSGLIETIANGVSLHSLKRSLTLATIAAGTNPRKHIATLKDHFVRTFGEVDSATYKAAADAFMRSLAAYSMLSYILQLKDRHNGNMLIDSSGHIIHIDFGFMLSNSPGSVGFEAAPFKLTYEFVDVLGGPTSAEFEAYKTLCKEAFVSLRKSADSIISIVEMMGRESKMACFGANVGGTVPKGGEGYVTSQLRQRFVLQLSEKEAAAYVDDLVAKSLGSYYTRLYDTFQYRTQGIY